MFAGLADAQKKKKRGEEVNGAGNVEAGEAERLSKRELKESKKKERGEKKRKRNSTTNSSTMINDADEQAGQSARMANGNGTLSNSHLASPLTTKPKKPRTKEPDHPIPPPPASTMIRTTATIPNSTSTPTSLSTSTPPFHSITAKLYLPISPLYSPHPWYSLEIDHLDPLILTYSSTLGGIILSYRHMRFLESGATIKSDSPFAYTWVSVEFLVWQPKRGMVLEGWINLQSQSHVGLLVLNTFNASVPREKIPKGWKWCEKREGFGGRKVRGVRVVKRRATGGGEGVEGSNIARREGEGNEEEEEEVEEEYEEEEEDSGGWIDENGNYVDGILRFTVDSVKASGHIVAIEGSLLDGTDRAEGQPAVVGNAASVVKLPLGPVREVEIAVEEGKRSREGEEEGDDEEEEREEQPSRHVEGKNKKEKKEKRDKKEKKEKGKDKDGERKHKKDKDKHKISSK